MNQAAAAVSTLRARGASSSAAAASEAWDGRLRLYKPRGQHLLTNPRVLDDIVRLAALRPGEAVLEVGPGTGNVTARLLDSPAAHVTAVEIDRRMAHAVSARAASLGLAHKLTVVRGDAMAVEFPEFDACVSSIPYGIASPLIAKLLFGRRRFRAATLLLQKELAVRLVSSAKNRLASTVRLVADVTLLMDVSRRDFVPEPAVDSCLVELRPRVEDRPREAAPGVELDEWLAFTRACFGKKDKTLGGIFLHPRKVLHLSRRARDDGGDDDCGGGEEEGDEEGVVAFRERIAGALDAAKLTYKKPSRLSNDELMRLLRLFNERGVRFH